MHGNELQRLKRGVKCSVTTTEDSEYDAQRTPRLEVVEQLPAAIVNAETVHDIAETVRFARENDLFLGVQNTGHGIARPCNGGILLRLSEMKNIAADQGTRTAIVEPGVQSGELLAAIEPLGFTYPTGQVSNVGVVGYTLGGGVGWLARKFGAACHRIKAATVVTADGSVVTATATENPDLFWALRSGGGNFGIVASLTVELFALGKIFGGLVFYRIEDAPEVLRFYRDWSANLTDDTSTVLRLMQLAPSPSNFLNLLHLHGSQTCAIGVCHADEATADRLHRQILAFKKPAVDTLAVRPYSKMAQFDQASSLGGAASFGNLECVSELSDAVLDGLAAMACDEIPPLAVIELQQLGGALNGAAESVAYRAPQAAFALRSEAVAVSASLEKLARDTGKAFDSLGAVYTGETSYNFLRGDQQNRVRDAFGTTKFTRLRAIKKQYDPTNFFSLNINIPPIGQERRENQETSNRSNKKMKVLVIGAAGKTGREVTEQAVAAGHEVTAFVREAKGFDVPNVRVVEGDAADSGAMEAAVAGQDAVIDTIGGKTPYLTTTLESSAAATIISAMQRSGVRRLIVTSMLGEGESKANAPIYERLLVATFLRGANKDKAAMESAVKASDLDWIILRPAILTEDAATGNVRVFDAETGEKAHKITRADLASFMIAQLSGDEYLHQAVTVANS